MGRGLKERVGFPKLVTVPDSGGQMAGFTALCQCLIFLQTRTVAVSITLRRMVAPEEAYCVLLFLDSSCVCPSPLHQSSGQVAGPFGLAGLCEAQQLLYNRLCHCEQER